jgi:hypothetical protein
VATGGTTASYTVTFDANGGIGTMSPQSIVSGTTARLSASALTFTGKSFAGWSTLPNGSVVYADQASYTMGSANVTLYAVWVANLSYTVTFNANGGAGTMSPQSIVSGTTAILSANAFTFAGKSFTGWSTLPNGSVVYAGQASYTMGSANVTLYAVWVANPSYTVTFNANGGAGTMSPQSIVSGTTAILSANAFTVTGRSFTGWSTLPNGSVAYADQASYTMGSANVTLYAVWVANSYTVTFNANGGAGTMISQSIVSGTSATLSLNSFTNAGWLFLGWATGANGTVAYVDRATFPMGSQDVMLYAIWGPRATVLVSFPSVAITPRTEGLMWDGTNLWVSETDDYSVYQINTTNGAKIGSGIAIPYEPHAIALEPGSSFFWGTDYWTDPPHLYRYAITGGSAQRTINLTSSQYAPFAMTYDSTGSVFWVISANGSSAMFSKIDYTTGSVLATWSLTGSEPLVPYGVCMDKSDNSTIWINCNTTLYKVSTTTHSVLDQYAFPTGAVGLLEGIAMINSNTFWMVDGNSNNIIKVQIQ